MRRLFIALDIPQDGRELLGGISDEISRSINGNFVGRDKMHVTVRFLGNPDASNARIIDAVKKVNEAFRREIDVKGVDAFYSGGRPSILFFGVFTDLSGVDSQISSLLGLEEDRRFHPHITVCRLRGNADVEGIKRRYKNFSVSFISNGLTLFDSNFKSYTRVTGPEGGS